MTSRPIAEDSIPDAPTELEERAWTSDVDAVTSSAAIPWYEAPVHYKHSANAMEMVPSLEVRVGREWARAIRPIDIRRHTTRAWFDACATHGYEVLTQTVDIDPNIRGGVPVLKGTGFTIAQAIAELADGDAVEGIATRFDLDAATMREMLFALALLFQRPCPR
jgi:uncharacterized protein (DUF433 family)